MSNGTQDTAICPLKAAAIAASLCTAGQAAAQAPQTIRCYVEHWGNGGTLTYSQNFTLRDLILTPQGAPYAHGMSLPQPVLLTQEFTATGGAYFHRIGDESGGSASVPSIRFEGAIKPKDGQTLSPPFVVEVQAMDNGAILGSMNFSPKVGGAYSTEYRFDIVWTSPQMIARMNRPLRLTLSSAGRNIVRYEVDATGLNPASFMVEAAASITGKRFEIDSAKRRAMPKVPNWGRNCP